MPSFASIGPPRLSQVTLGLTSRARRRSCRTPWRARRGPRGPRALRRSRVDRQHLAPELDADLGLLDALGRELGDLEELVRARRTGVETLGLAALETEELLPVATLLVRLTQVVDGRRVVGLEVQRPARTPSPPRPDWRTSSRRDRPRACRAQPSRLVGHQSGELEDRLDVVVESLSALLLLGERHGARRSWRRRRDRRRVPQAARS